MTRNRHILLKKGLICHFLLEFVKSQAVGGFQNKLSTLVRYKEGSEPVLDSARCCRTASLGWCPSQGVLSLCVQYRPLALVLWDAFFVLVPHVQFFICISNWL